MTGEGQDVRTPGQGVLTRVWFLNLAIVVIALGCTLLLAARPEGAASPGVHPQWWVLVVAFAALELVVVHLHLGRQTVSFSLSEVPLLVGLTFAAPLALVGMRVAGNVVALLGSRQSPHKLVFNIAHWWLETVLAIVVWDAVLAGADPLSPRGWLAALTVALVTDTVAALAIVMAVAATEGRPTIAALAQQLLGGPVAALTNASFGIVVLTVLEVDWRAGWTLVVVAVVLLGAYHSITSLQRRHDSLEQLADFTSRVGSDLRTAAIGRQVVARVAELMRADVVELALDEDGDLLRLVWAGGATQDRSGEPGTLAAGLLAPQADTLIAPRNTRDAGLRQRLEAARLTDAVVVPLRGAGKVVGTLLAANRLGDVDTFDAEELTVLEALANHATVALHNGRLADSLRREADRREHEALHDPLTGLPNRRHFDDRVAGALARGGPVAVLLLDLDRFKEINDTLGHQTGDLLLVEVGRRLRATLPPLAVVARLGGDEFVVAVSGCEEIEAAELAGRLRNALAQPFTLRTLPLQVDVSIGIALAPRDGADAEGLLRRADVAMYSAKRAHSGLEFYSSERDQYSPKRLALVAELRHAIEIGALGVVYQPKVRLQDGVVLGVEALVRWNHPQHGNVPPSEFVPIAEHTGLMRPLTLHVLHTALSQARVWRGQGLELGVAVNLSARSLLDPTLVDDVLAALAEYGMQAHLLTLEITESDILEDPLHATNVLRRLQELGIHRSVDDFGTGYSSLSYLNQLPVDEMKIDRSFVVAMPTDPDALAIVGAVVDLGRRLRKRIVAEGVETEQHWHQLRALGCDVAQGYLLSRPIDGDQIVPWARAYRPLAPERTELRSLQDPAAVASTGEPR